MSTTVPLIVCGAARHVATQVKANMLPEYDVVYAGHDLPASAKEVPQIISGSPPPSASLHTDVGSNEFTILPRAIVTGGGYNDEAFQRLYQACADACGSEANLPVPFFRVDNAITTKLEAEGKGPKIGGPEYPKAIADRLKDKLKGAGIASGMPEQTGNKGKIFLF